MGGSFLLAYILLQRTKWLFRDSGIVALSALTDSSLLFLSPSLSLLMSSGSSLTSVDLRFSETLVRFTVFGMTTVPLWMAKAMQICGVGETARLETDNPHNK